MENECTEFGCRLEQAKKHLHEWVERHDLDQQRIAELERELAEAKREIARLEAEVESDSERWARLTFRYAGEGE